MTLRLALYGTLMQGCGGDRRAGVAGALRYQGPCRIPGALWDLGPYSGLAAGEAEVRGELVEVDDTTLERLDAFEDEGSLYLRCKVRLIEPDVEAWVYVYNQPLDRAEPIPAGCWRTHVATRGGSQSG